MKRSRFAATDHITPLMLRKLDRERWNLDDRQIELCIQLLQEVQEARNNNWHRDLSEHAPYAMAALFPGDYEVPKPRQRIGVINHDDYDSRLK